MHPRQSPVAGTAGASIYAPPFERGACGLGFVADRAGRASHGLLQLGLQALANLQHRGALDADARTGDGAGLLLPLPRRLLAREAERLTGQACDPASLGVGVFFWQPGTRAEALRLAEAAFAAQGVRLVAWRAVPVEPGALGEQARATQPEIWHALLAPGAASTASAAATFEQRLYLARRQFEREARPLGAYVPSCSARTLVYKGLLLAPQLPEFYPDLRDPDFEVALVLFHQRYSTNTQPTWQRAQPFRVLCHNGEINTLQGNLAWAQAREPLLAAPWASAADLRPVIDRDGSDSAMLDNVAELLALAGRELPHAITMLVPPAWEKHPELPPAVRDFYAYHAGLSEPWDGPAALMFTDGQRVGAALDRNGLRPCRYLITGDGLVAAASEAGAVPVDPEAVRVRGRLGPGQMLVVDTARGEVHGDAAVKRALAARRPYGVWLSQARRLPPAPGPGPARAPGALTGQQAAFGYTAEELVMVLRPMVETGAEAIGAMGDDTPLAVLSPQPRPLFAYFRQRFAEVTNPPIDPLREALVMSLSVRLGRRGNLLDEAPEAARLLVLASPLLTEPALAALRADPDLRAATLSTLFPAAAGAAGLEAALTELAAAAEAAVRAGAQALVLSDRGVDAEHSFIPALLALGAVHHHLLRAGLRAQAALVVESGEPREVHHFAALIGFGAAAVCPYLALATAASLARGGRTPDEAVARYLAAAEHGLLKVMSKMGISTLDAYCGAQVFEAIGLSPSVVARHFTGTPAHLAGLDLAGIAGIVLRWHAAAFGAASPALSSPGVYKFKHDGETHGYSPAVVRALHAAVRTPGALEGNWAAGYAAYQQYSALQHSAPPVDVHDLLETAPAGQPLPLSAVESSHALLWRFSTAAMSHGALSAEAHEVLALAMNRLDALSNSGEGGEAPERYTGPGNNRIKQVASARFGVTAAYLASADELQIKMAQGSKPGEGGQLPGHKVTAEIAALRHATPGVTLISPPPHHDIYSIEDLAQLIYDLRQVNPGAAISVKLVAQAGVGTIAAGVAKAGADVIHLAGANGGTGASPLGSIKYAGLPWELGLAEAQYVLSQSGLRGRVRLRVDGGLRTGRDVVIAALLGADEFSFGTAALVAAGCVMARACHLNTCPAGIATQRPELRARFDGRPEQVMALMLYVAQEVREVLAGLGLASLEDATGRVELLRASALAETAGLDLGQLLLAPAAGAARRYLGEANRVTRAAPLNDQLLRDAAPLGLGGQRRLSYAITNRERAFGARLAGEFARRAMRPVPNAGREVEASPQTVASGPPQVEVALTGSAGQSLGAFAGPGLNLTLRGEANDYVGKGLAGGRIVIALPEAPGDSGAAGAGAPVLAGNTVLYGATAGELYLAGRAGERFAVRNSGAIAVVEGMGDHGCEYMTGGLVICLGSIGVNFGAGMTGGLAYLLDDGETAGRLNRQLVHTAEPDRMERDCLRAWVQRHAALTGSSRARDLLARWKTIQFVAVIPKDGPPPMMPIPVEEPVERVKVIGNW